jgi:hypothetical protein
MLFALLGTTNLTKWMQVNAPTFLTGRTPVEAWRAYLVSVVGSSNQSLNELERSFMRIKLASGNTHADLVTSYMQVKGKSKNNKGDSCREWANSGTA